MVAAAAAPRRHPSLRSEFPTLYILSYPYATIIDIHSIIELIVQVVSCPFYLVSDR